MKFPPFLAGLAWFLSGTPGLESAGGQEAPPVEIPVYESRFDESVSRKHWSSTNTGVTPKGNRVFLGEFARDDAAVLSLEDLPEHRFVRLRCRLLVLKCTDGSSMRAADVWQIALDGDMTLLQTTFCNAVAKPAEGEVGQAYPDESPFGYHAPGTGATESLDFGYTKPALEPCQDAVYDIDLVFPHHGQRLGLTFCGTYHERKEDESWGLESVRVDVLPEARALAREGFDDLWSRLSGQDPVVANKALWELVAAGEPVIAWIRGKRIEALAAETARANGLGAAFGEHLQHLDADDFEDRQAAERALREMGRDINPLLEAAIGEGKASPEQRRSLLAVHAAVQKAKAGPRALHDDLVRSRVDHLLRVASISAPDAVAVAAEENGRADVDGAIALNARSGRPRGIGQRPMLVAGDRQIPSLRAGDFYQWEYWYGTGVSLAWDVAGLKPGRYKVEVSTSSPEEHAGDRFRLRFDDPKGTIAPASLEGTLVGSGQWDLPIPTSAGSVTIGENAGLVRVTLEPLETAGNSFTNLAGIRLVPVP